MKNAGKIALGGSFTALSVVIMFLGSIIPAANYALPAMAGILLMVVAIEINSKWAFMIFLAVSILSMLLVPSKETAVFYIMLFGHYPIIKGFIERIHSAVLVWIIKYLVFNVCVVSAFLLIMPLLGIEPEGMNNLGKYSVYILWGLGNIAFAIYDLALTGIVGMYMSSLHKHMKKLIK